jgi:cereblon
VQYYTSKQWNLQICRFLQCLVASSALRCAVCQAPLACTQHKLTMTEQEQDTMFVNPFGATHGLTCVSKIFSHRLLYQGPPSTTFSWFPGYAWTMFLCKGCGVHLGWRFTRTPDLKQGPDVFWGLAHGSVQVDAAKGRTLFFGDPDVIA